MLLDLTPASAGRVVGVVELAQFVLLPLGLVSLGVQEVDPLLPALDLRVVEAPLFQLDGNKFPFFGFEARLELFQQFHLLNESKCTSEVHYSLALL